MPAHVYEKDSGKYGRTSTADHGQICNEERPLAVFQTAVHQTVKRLLETAALTENSPAKHAKAPFRGP